jgi:hypothetical protein
VATSSSLLANHVTLQVRSVDRLFFQGYVPPLQTQFQVSRRRTSCEQFKAAERAGRFSVVMVGIALERTSACRLARRRLARPPRMPSIGASISRTTTVGTSGIRVTFADDALTAPIKGPPPAQRRRSPITNPATPLRSWGSHPHILLQGSWLIVRFRTT